MIPKAPFIQQRKRSVQYRASVCHDRRSRAQERGFQRTPQPPWLETTSCTLDPECSLLDQQRHRRDLRPPNRVKLGLANRKASPGQVPDTAAGQRKMCGLYQVDLQCPAGEIIAIFTWKITCYWLWDSILKKGVEGPDFSYCHCLSNDVESGQDLSSQPFQGGRQRSVIITQGL